MEGDQAEAQTGEAAATRMNLHPYYAGIGSRETPPEILREFKALAEDLAARGYCLRSGGADGADSAFEEGCDRIDGPKQIFLPWDGFNGRRADRTKGVFSGAGPKAIALAAQHHPAWRSCGRGARALHARNGYQILGPNLEAPVEFVVCWTIDGSGKGGTGQALRIAAVCSIPVYDFGLPEARAKFTRERLAP